MPGRPSPTIPDGGLFCSYGEAKINASPLAVYEAIIHTEDWPKWSTFVPKVDILNQPDGHKDSAVLVKGTEMILNVQMTDSFKTENKEVVNILDDPPSDSDAPGTIRRIDWITMGSVLAPKMMLSAERVNEIERADDGTTLYRTWETFTGPYARLVKWKLESTLQERFNDWARDLKAYVEKTAAST